jgi:hypothetical protein
VCRTKGYVKSLLYLLMQYPDGKELSQQELKVMPACDLIFTVLSCIRLDVC